MREKQTVDMPELKMPNPEKPDLAINEMPDIPMSKNRILKNVFVVSLGFLFLFTAFQSMANLQTSLNKEDGVGAWSLSTIYVSLIVSCLFLPKFIIARLGCKWTIPISMVGYILYMGANFYAVKGTMIPAAIILGLGAAPLWSAKCTYLTQLGVWYSKLTKLDKDATINYFFGFFFLFFQSSQIWGNLIISTIFAKEKDNSTEENKCGVHFSPDDANSNETDKFNQDMDKIYTVCGIYLGCAVIAALVVILFLDKILLDQETTEEDRHLSPKLLFSTIKHLFSSPIQMLLIPITIYSGVEQAFIGGDFTKAFIACSLGIWNVGYVMICYGVVDATCSFFFGHLVKYVGHIPFFILAFLTHGSIQIAMLFWDPSSDTEILFYIIAALWGMGDAVIQTQLNALYGDLFTANTEAGFANYRLWESVGFAVTYAYNDYIDTDVKLYICISVLIKAIIGYLVVETKTRMERSQSFEVTKE